ncbi:hypothetical protein BJX61DRAFT_1566 [Aspergillus egyptiacus]|nr:hypothetical protein BJX61DRAFT_1566 [Aspergillus egyptiacus]
MHLILIAGLVVGSPTGSMNHIYKYYPHTLGYIMALSFLLIPPLYHLLHLESDLLAIKKIMQSKNPQSSVLGTLLLATA